MWKFEIDFKKSRFSRLRSTLACTPLTKSEKKRCCPALLIKEIDTESQFVNYDFRYSKNPLCPVLLDMTFHCFMLGSRLQARYSRISSDRDDRMGSKIKTPTNSQDEISRIRKWKLNVNT